jgi:hypothetical protein
MTTLKFLSAGFVVAAMIASPALAREGKVKHANVDAYASTQRVPASVKRGCVRSPDVGAYATAPWRQPPCEPSSRY